MFLHVIFLSLSLVTSMGSLYGSSCDEECSDKPVFTPSKLIVQHGAPASVSCTACQNDCKEDGTGLDVSVGEAMKNGSLMLWQVDSVTDWDLSVTCYYTKDDGNRCCSHLPVTVYQLPSSVSMQFSIEPYYSGYSYTLQCLVEDAAPVQNVHVTFYSDYLRVMQQQCKNTSKTPERCISTVNGRSMEEVTASKYWCEAKLDLGPEGPPPLLLASKPRRDSSYDFNFYRTVSASSSHIHSCCLCFMLHLCFFLSCWILF